MTEVVIVNAVRTPIGRHGGALSAVRPDDLVALVLREVVERAGIDPAEVEEVYLGCANQAGEDNRNVARMATLLAGFPQQVAAVTVNRLCASGLNAINQAARAIRSGEGEVYIAGDDDEDHRQHHDADLHEIGRGAQQVVAVQEERRQPAIDHAHGQDQHDQEPLPPHEDAAERFHGACRLSHVKSPSL